jgi:SAM-dependent methyltransferase
VGSLIIQKQFKKLAAISEIPYSGSHARIFNLAIEDSFSKYLNGYENYYCSEYLSDILPGTEIRNKVYCQNVEALTFENEYFDLVISEDVFEHVRDYYKGFAEVRRVLKIGGYHIFTIPCYFDRTMITRVDTTRCEDIYLLPPEYHGDPRRGLIIAYRTFGIDIYSILSNLGFYTEVFFSKYIDRKWGIFDSYCFVSKKI